MVYEIQVKVVTGRNGSRKAGYRSRLANGLWAPFWTHMTVADAVKALRDGTAHVGATPGCKVFEYA